MLKLISKLIFGETKGKKEKKLEHPKKILRSCYFVTLQLKVCPRFYTVVPLYANHYVDQMALLYGVRQKKKKIVKLSISISILNIIKRIKSLVLRERRKKSHQSLFSYSTINK